MLWCSARMASWRGVSPASSWKLSSVMLEVTWCLSTLLYRLAAWVAVYLSTKMVGWKHQEWVQTSNSSVQQSKQLSFRAFQRPVLDCSRTFKIKKGQCSFRFYNEMCLNNMCNVCWVSRTVEKASGIFIPRRTDIFKGPNEPVDWRHTQGTVSGSVLPFRFSFSQPNVRVRSYYFCVEYLGQSLSPVTVSVLHRFRLWMIIRIRVQKTSGIFAFYFNLRDYSFCFPKNVHVTVIKEKIKSNNMQIVCVGSCKCRKTKS